jgi:predicted dehydrogenase
MRDIIGMPKKVIGASLGFPGIYTALLQYDGFPVTFESGVNTVPVFDANIEVYSPDKIVRIQYDSPYVRGLPVKMIVRDRMDSDAPQGSYAYRETTVTKTYQDPFTAELLELYECVVNGKPVKTSAADARNEVELFKMILQAGEKTYHST